MTTINLGNVVGNQVIGISSNLDSQAIIDSLKTVKQRPIDTLNTKITTNNSKITQFSNLKSLIDTLQSSANYLRNPVGFNSSVSNIFQYKVASLSSSTLTASSYLSVVANPGALVGSTRVEIGQLAKALEKRSGYFNARDVDATTSATGSYFNAGTFQIGSGIVSPVSGTTKSGFALQTGDYAVEGSATGVITAGGISNITVTGISGGQVGLEGTLSGFTGTLGSGTATFTVVKNGVTYTSNAVDVTQSVNGGLNAGIASGTVLTFTANSGGAFETSFQLTTASDITIDNTQSNVDTFATNITTALAGQSVYQSRKISNFVDANVKSPLTGLTNNNIRLYSNNFSTASTGDFGQISGFSVQKSTGSDGAISVVINGETFRVSGLGTTVNSNLVLKSTSTEKELRINLADAAVSVDISSDANAANLERSFDYAFGTRTLTSITVTSGQTLNDIIYNINSKSSLTGASAAITKVSDFSYLFNLKANIEGVDNRYDIFDDSGVLTNVGLTTTQSDQNAKIRVDGIEVTRSTNSITDVVENVTLNLLAVTPNYNGGSPDSVSVNVDNDIDTVVNGIKNFLDAYNAIRVYYSEQSQRDPTTNAYTTDAILGGDTTLGTYVDQLLNEINTVVSGTSSSDFNSLSDAGITLQDFAGDSQNVATKNILTYDDTALRKALTDNYDKIREIFEFKLNSSSSDLALLKSSNDFTLNNFKLDIDTSRAVGQQVKLLNADGTEYLQGGQPVYLDGTGTTITGRAGTPVAGLQFLYTGDGTDVISISISQGIADKVYNLDDGYDKDGGIIDNTVQSLTDTNTKYQSNIITLQAQLDSYVASLQAKFAALEEAISSANNILALISANLAVATANTSGG